MPGHQARYSPQEVASRGEAIYQRLRAKLEHSHKGDFVVMDIETGEYEVAREDLEATNRLLAKRPDAVLYGVRIGYATAYRLGGLFSAVPQ